MTINTKTNEFILNEVLNDKDLINKLKQEVDELKLISFKSDTIHKDNFKKLRYLILDNLKRSKYSGFISLDSLRLLYIIYTSDKQLPLLHKLFFFNKKILLGGLEDTLKKIYSKEELLKIIPSKKQLFYFLIDLSEFKTKDSNLLNIFNRLIFQFQSNSSFSEIVFIKDTKYLFLNKFNSNLIINFFEQLKNPILKNSDDEKIPNIFTLEQFLEKYKDDKVILSRFFEDNMYEIYDLFEISNLEHFLDFVFKEGFKDYNLQKNTDHLFVVNSTIKLKNIFSLVNNYSEFDFNWLLTPFSFKKSFSLNMPTEIPINIKIKIFQKEYLNQNETEMLLSKITYVCPGCGKRVLLDSNEVGTYLSHKCDPIIKKTTRIKTNILMPEVQIPLTLYKTHISSNYDEVLESNKDDKWARDIYIYSFNNSIEPGVYLADIIKFNGDFNILSNKNKKNLFYLILGIKKMKNKYIENKIIKNDEEITQTMENENIQETQKTQFQIMQEMKNKKRIQKHKIWNILFSIRQYYKNRFGMEIDNSGMFTQLTALISSIARSCFKENKLGISIMGVGSVSKTFPCNMIFSTTDLNYRYISDAGRMTSAGMTGGINTNAMINGMQVKKFEKGVISNNGSVVFDEAQSIFLNKDIQAIIKSIPQDEYEVAVTGGRKIDFNCTPIFLSNFNEFMYKYEKRIIDAYVLKYKSTYKFENERKLKTNQDIIKYVSKINLYQNIEYYYDTMGDEILANIIFAVRKQFESERIDWKTGSQIEAMNRLLFDTVVHRKNYQIEVNLLEGLFKEENTKDINLSENMPIQQINEEILRYIYNEEDLNKITKIDVKNESKNNIDRVIQLQKLNKAIHKFLTEEELGINISKYYIQNVDNFDKKIRELVIKVIKTLQLIENVDSTYLSEETKELANQLLLKCKRGLTQEEYDWDTNVTEIKIYPKLNTDFLVDLEDNKTELYYEQKRQKDMESIEKDIENKYGLTKKEKDNSLNEKSINFESTEIDNDFGSLDSLEELNKEYNIKEICKRLNLETEDEQEMLEFVKKLKIYGVIYELRNGVYKISK